MTESVRLNGDIGEYHTKRISQVVVTIHEMDPKLKQYYLNIIAEMERDGLANLKPPKKKSFFSRFFNFL